MNSVNLIGRITKNPEMRTSSNGKSFVAFTLAINEFSNGNQFTQFVPCFAWEKTAENLCKYVSKGQQIAVEGAVNVRQDTVNGQQTQIVTIRCNRIEFLMDSSKTTQSKDTSQDWADKINDKEEYTINDSSDDDDILWSS